MLSRFASDVAPGMPHSWRAPLPAEWFSKEIGLRLENLSGRVPETGELLCDAVAIIESIARHLTTGQALLKAPFACAGRGHLRVNHDSNPAKTRGWIQNTLAAHGAVVVEPWLDRLLDFSALYEAKDDGVAHLGFTVMENDAAGRFTGIRVGPKWGNLLDADIAAFLFREADVLALYQKQLPPLLADLLPGYRGPLCVDAMVHRRADGSPALKPVVELNVRHTMGRLAWEWMKPLGGGPGRLRILRKPALSPQEIQTLADGPGLFLNDPAQAEQFLAYWSVDFSPP
jgi:hypothetical protein